MSQNVTKCYKMSQNVTKCHKMLQNVTKCHKMSKHVTKCYKISQDIKICHKMLTTEYTSWYKTPSPVWIFGCLRANQKLLFFSLIYCHARPSTCGATTSRTSSTSSSSSSAHGSCPSWPSPHATARFYLSFTDLDSTHVQVSSPVI